MRFQTYSVVNRTGRVLYHPDPSPCELEMELIDISKVKGYSLMVDVGEYAYPVVGFDETTHEPLCLDETGDVFAPQ